MERIPRVAYYIWIGDKKKPKIFYQCLDSWKKYLKDFKIIEINEKNIDLNKYMENRFFKECYQKKLWAYCSDYIRTDVLYNNGGIYLDIDMQILRPIDDLLSYDFFIGYESNEYLGVGLYGASKNCVILKDLLDFYNQDIYTKSLWTIPKILTSIVKEKGYFNLENTKYLEERLFYPFSLNEKFTTDCIKKDTYAIHWWNASWSNLRSKLFLETKHLSGIKKILKKIKIVLRVYLKGY
ncbi:glycosyltransferase family 32 protein [Sneathia vaginalis]|uniref:glycosyltransferase family 32 protein n=1 Tax=Sneathia vaginalis TaxID=187101 RepID=UPI00259618BC|nr:glycosyltransferase [uncultured Sneathia sp.]